MYQKVDVMTFSYNKPWRFDKSSIPITIKSNEPHNVVVDCSEYDEIERMQEEREMLISDTADSLISENLEALKALAT